MTGNTNALFFAQNPADPKQQQQTLAFMRAQMLAQQYAKAGEMPADNEMAGNVVVRHSPLEYLSRTISQQQGMSQQLKAAQMQMQLMGQGAQGGSGAAGITSGGLNYAQQRKAAMDGMMFGDEAQKADLADMARTNNQKEAEASGARTPQDYQKLLATDAENAKIVPRTVGGVENVPVRNSDLANSSAMNATESPTSPSFGLGGTPPAPPAMQGAAPPTVANAMPLNGANNAVAGMGNPDAVPAQAAPANAPPPLPAGQAVPPVPPVDQGVPLAPVPAPPAAQQGIAPPAIGDDPRFKAQVAAQGEGQKEQYKNLAGYENGLNKRVSDGESQLRIINAQEDLAQHFRAGAGAEELAKAAAAASALGASPSLVSSIARGDRNAIAAVQAFSAMASQHAATQALETMAGGGGNTPRISQAMFESFKDNLSNPNNQPQAIKAINALARQQYMSDFSEQQAFKKFKGNPLDFQSQYSAQMNPQLMAGRSADPAQAIQGAQLAPPPDAIKHLQKNPSLAAQFDQKYGLGAAAKLLGK